MSSRREGGFGAKLPSSSATESSKGKNVNQVNDFSADQLANRVANKRLDSEQVPRNRYARKAGSQNSSAKVRGIPMHGKRKAGSQNSNALAPSIGRGKAWSQPSLRSNGNNYNQPDVTPQRSYMSVVAYEDNVTVSRPADATADKEEEKDGDEIADDFYDSDEYDTDESQKSHETRKKNKSFKDFFENLDKMNLDEINKDREWHCPACSNGRGAICRYKGLQPLINHAKTKGKDRVKVHREFAELLEEELRIREISVITAGEAFGKWRGLNENVLRDKEIVWPPMVIIKNTLLEQDDDGKWLGMGNAELLEYFSAYEAVSSSHSYGPQGHRGISLLIFEASAMGFMEAERLSNHFEDEGTGRDAWDRPRERFLPGGQRQLYGYMASKRDLDDFNKHSHGKLKKKIEMRSYQELVISKLKQMSEDNHLWQTYKNKVEERTKELEVLKASFGAVTEKMQRVSKENNILRQSIKLHHEQIKEEMDALEEFYNEFKHTEDIRNKKEENLEKIQQEQREETKQYMETPSAEEHQSRLLLAKLPSSSATESSKGKNVNRVANTRLDSEQVPRNRYARKAGSQNSSAKVRGIPMHRKRKAGSQNSNALAPSGSQNSNALAPSIGRGKAWSQPSLRSNGNNYNQPDVTPQRSYISVVAYEDNVTVSRPADATADKEEEKDGDEIADDIYDSDEYDTDESQKSHETRKKNKSFKDFFENLDKMNLDEINKDREWHCPACSNGRGAICRYKGLQPLINHAKTKGKDRVKVHREFAELLEEELRIREISVIPAGEAFGKWRGLNENVLRDKEIVWPPMVIIKNTLLEQDDDGKWLGMGNAELLEYFIAYEAVSSSHSYGPQGHRGISLLIFEASAMGFMEAERLSNHFEDEGTGRDAWDRPRERFLPGGQRQLYGYMASKRDLDDFNKHSHGKLKQKFEMRSYQELVISKLKQMSEDNHLWQSYKNKVEERTKELEVLKASFGAVTEKMQRVSKENNILRQSIKLHHEQIKEEMDALEEFYNEFKHTEDIRNKKEENLEKIQQEQREETKQYMETPSAEDHQSRIETGTTMILSQQKEMDIYTEERKKLLKDQEERKAELKRQQYEENVKLEGEFNAELAQLTEKYNPH